MVPWVKTGVESHVTKISVCKVVAIRKKVPIRGAAQWILWNFTGEVFAKKLLEINQPLEINFE